MNKQVYQHVFYVSEPHLAEYANHIYHEAFKLGIIMYVAIPQEWDNLLIDVSIYHKIYIESINNHMHFENVYCNYCYKEFESRCTNWWKICYGLGNDNFIYAHKHKTKKLRGYLACSEYDAYKMSFICPSYVIGLAKLNVDDVYQHSFDKLIDAGYDPKKKTILFLHTWKKTKQFGDAYAKSGCSDYLETAKQLQTLTDKYNIIHKNHHNTHKEFEGFINVPNGFDSKALLKAADLTIADYGGSAIEACLTDGLLIYVDDEDNLSLTRQNLDNFVHNIFTHCVPSRVLDMVSTMETFPLNSAVQDVKHSIANFFIGNTYNPAKVFAKFMYALDTGADLRAFKYDEKQRPETEKQIARFSQFLIGKATRK